jgi:lipopolysaccharide/colanic/teichoic acid biosynthesis glycosyltransferase
MRRITGAELQMYRNIGGVVPGGTASKVALSSVAEGPDPSGADAMDSAWLTAAEGGAGYAEHLPGTRPSALHAPSAAEESATLRADSSSGLSYLWHDDLPALPPMTGARLAGLRFKRGMDILLAIVSILIFGPLFVLAAVAVKLSSKGPVFFKQQRVGHRNELFSVYKFRTMYIDRQDESGVAQTTAEDPRITAVGRLLRRTSIDEVPQIINILKGEMSFVGPRPHVPGMLAGGLPYEQLVPYYDLRHTMRPGLTGWAQANGFRGPTIDPIMARQRVDHDIAYVQNFSVWLDMHIIAKTAWREFITGTGV